MYQVMPGAKPASAVPSTKRAMRKSWASCTRDMRMPAMPQTVIDSSSHGRMPQRRSSSACGYWNIRYATKNVLTPRPNVVGESPTDRDMGWPAKLTFIRSMALMKVRIAMGSSSRHTVRR